jgi:hypothetical protein
MAITEGKEAPVSALRLVVSLLLAGLICGVIIGFAYLSLLLFAPLEGLGVPATACLAAALLIKTEQATVFMVNKWRPAVLPLVLAALPATGVAFVLRGLGHWHGVLGVVSVVAGGLVVQGLVLHFLMARVVPKWSEPVG